MASNKKWTIRKSTEGDDRRSSWYLVARSEPQGKSVSAPYRFAKVSVSEATTFRNEADATKILRSFRSKDRCSDAKYFIVPV